jgi:hypothetical protein
VCAVNLPAARRQIGGGGAGERGQASPEWVALVALVALMSVVLAAGVGPRLPGAALARTIAGRLVCAIELSDACDRDPELVAAYGADLARALRRHAPQIAYEEGMHALPVDYRRCRSPSCADGPGEGLVWRSWTGEPAAAFVHVIDCRAGAAAPFAGVNDPVDCRDGHGGNLYLQYWLYYPDSATARGVPVVGSNGFHEDDWEGYQVRIGRDGRGYSRASSHHGYNYEQGAANAASDLGWGPIRAATETIGLRPHNGWGPETGWLFVSGGSHAGNAKANPFRYSRATPGRRLKLIPLDPAATGEERPVAFAVTAPWLKGAWLDPEAEGTD